MVYFYVIIFASTILVLGGAIFMVRSTIVMLFEAEENFVNAISLQEPEKPCCLLAPI